MIIARWLFDRTLDFQEKNWQRAYDALREQNAELLKRCAAAEERAAHERGRAEDAINRLLLKEQNLPPILDRKAEAEPDLRNPILESKLKALDEIFSKVNGVGEDDGLEAPENRIVTVNGVAVGTK